MIFLNSFKLIEINKTYFYIKCIFYKFNKFYFLIQNIQIIHYVDNLGTVFKSFNFLYFLSNYL